MTTKETLYMVVSSARMQASRVRNEMQKRDYTTAEKDIDILCELLCDALCNNFTDEQACKMFDKFGI